MRQPVWDAVLDHERDCWQAALSSTRAGKKVLIPTSVGGHLPATILESTLAVSLTLRGAEVHILLCDKALPACLKAQEGQFWSQSQFARFGPRQRTCPTCFAPADKMYGSLGIPVHHYSDFITIEGAQRVAELATRVPFTEIGSFTLDGLAIGEHALAGALRFYARGDLEGEPYAEPILRRYFHASLLTAQAIQQLFAVHKFDVACFHHGIYVPQGIIAEVARQQGVHVCNWNPAYRKRCFIFTHHETYHHALLSEPTANWENISWSDRLETEGMDYLKSRWQGTRDWIWFHDKPQENIAAIVNELKVDFSKPCIGMLTNVIWDAQLHYRANAFPNMLDWVIHTIRYFARHPNLQLIVRIHPAELRGLIPSRQPLQTEIKKAFPVLPPNVFIIPPESRISTYAAMLQCNAVLIYGTKTGVELASLGLPVIVAGEAWIRGKGVTYDAGSPEEYFKLLDQLPFPHRLDAETTLRVRKYAYHFFFRRMIPLRCIKPTGGSPPYQLHISGLDDLAPGQDAGLDVICDGILNGTEFIYPAEQYAEIPA